MEASGSMCYPQYFIGRLPEYSWKAMGLVHTSEGEERVTNPETSGKADAADSAPDVASGKKDRRKINITLSIDEPIIQELRREAKESGQSLNTRINAILRKHVNFYYPVIELNGAAIIHPSLVQFMIGEMDESKFIDHWKNTGTNLINSLFVQKHIPATFDNFVRFAIEEQALGAGVIRNVLRYVDEKDGRKCLFLLHGYDEKWSRIIGAAYSYHIEELLHYHTALRIFPNGVEIKVIEKDPI